MAFEFFTERPLWAKVLMVGGAGAAGYAGYRWWAAPTKRRYEVPSGGMGPVDVAASLPAAPAPAAAVQQYAAPPLATEYVEVVETPELEWDETLGVYVPIRVRDREWERRWHDGWRPPPPAAYPAGYPSPAFPGRPAPPPPMARPAPPPPMARPAAPFARPAPPVARPAPPAPRPAPPSGRR